MCVPQTGWNYIGKSTCLKTRQTVHNIHKLLLFDINASDVLLI